MEQSARPLEGRVVALRGAALAESLLRARTPDDVAALLLQAGGAPAGACVLWSSQWPMRISTYPEDCGTWCTAAAIRAIDAARSGEPLPADIHLLHDDNDMQVAAVYCPEGCVAPAEQVLADGAERMAEVLSIERLNATVSQLEQSEQLQRSLYAIADMAGSDLDMPDMLRGLHRIISELLYAENIYIALYDGSRDVLDFLYFVDTVDPEGPQLGDEVPLSEIEHGLTWYLLHDRKPLMGSDEELSRQVSGPLRLRGASSSDWLGVPMMRDGEVRGVLVVQSYLAGSCYSTADMSLLAFVAEHILTALERKQGQAVLERRVAERTAQLADANLELRREVAERERGEQLQAVLYRIAALAGMDESSERFFKHVHDSVGELISARNFYIALLSEDREEVCFPYVRDELKGDWAARRGGRGLTEYVLRTGKAQLIDQKRLHELIAAGEVAIDPVDVAGRIWLGVPLFGENTAIGVVAVHGDAGDEGFGERNIELLTFVSYQIASSLLRFRAAEQLRLANVELEQRVEARTAELREQMAVREGMEAQLQHQVMHDALTGLPNRIYLRDRLERAMARLRRDPSQTFGVLYLDVDRFKVINDSLGHMAGDMVLEQVARRLSAAVREPDVVARLAGDEFAILIEHVSMPETACKVAQRMLELLQPALEVDGRQLQVSASVGVAIVNGQYASPDQILHDADLALYRAKEAGRNRFVLFDEVMHRNAMDVLDLEQGLRDALARDEFEPHFQPLVRLDDGVVVGYEALLRWRHPQRGLLAPGDFLAVAEDSGLIEAIDWRMFGLALRAGRELVAPDRFLTLNVSPRLFQREDFDRRLLGLTAELGFDPGRLRIEVTEGTLLHDPEAVLAVLQRLRDVRIEAALDDFGTGYSSLGQVHRFPLKMIKIDRSFVAPFAEGSHGSRSCAVIEAILALGRALAIEILAEGIETEFQRAALAGMGCKFAQGYLFGRPAPAAHWLAAAGAP